MLPLCTALLLATAAAPAAVAPADAATSAAANDDPIARLEGVYKHRFRNGDAYGGTFTSENILEVVRHAPGLAYFRVHLDFFNGHVCNVWGMARVEGARLVYEVPDPPTPEPCRIELEVDAGKVILRDVPQTCAKRDRCGARGTVSAEWPYAARRAIRYLPRLLASEQYAQARSELDARRPSPAPAERR